MSKANFSSLKTLTKFGPGEEWILPGLVGQDMLHMNEYHSGFHPRYGE